MVGISSLFRLDESLDVRISASGLRAAALISALSAWPVFHTPAIPSSSARRVPLLFGHSSFLPMADVNPVAAEDSHGEAADGDSPSAFSDDFLFYSHQGTGMFAERGN